MDVAGAHVHSGEILLQFLGHPLGKGGHQNALVLLGADFDLLQQVVHLVLDGTHLHGRVQQACRPDNLLHHGAAALLQFIVARSGADKESLAYQCVEFVELQGPVVGRRGKSESILDERLLARTVASVHRPHLWQRDVALVYESQEPFGEIVYQAEWPHSGRPAVKIAGIVLDSGAVADLLDHLQIVLHAPLQTLGFQMLAYLFEIVALLHHIVLYLPHRTLDALARCDEIVGREDRNLGVDVERGARGGVHRLERFDLVAEEDDAEGELAVGGEDVHRVAFDAEAASAELRLGA